MDRYSVMEDIFNAGGDLLFVVTPQIVQCHRHQIMVSVPLLRLLQIVQFSFLHGVFCCLQELVASLVVVILKLHHRLPVKLNYQFVGVIFLLAITDN